MKLLRLGASLCISLSMIYPAYAFEAYGPVTRGESLWAIAKNHQISKVSNRQMITAIFRLNPEAFRSDAISSLKVGSRLWLPVTPSEVHEVLEGHIPPKREPKISANPQVAISQKHTVKNAIVAVKAAHDSAENKTPAAALRAGAQDAHKVVKPPEAAPEQAKLAEDAEALNTAQQALLAANQKLQLLQQQNQALEQKSQDQQQQIQSLATAAETLNNQTGIWSWIWFILFMLAAAVAAFMRYQIYLTQRSHRYAAANDSADPDRPEGDLSLYAQMNGDTAEYQPGQDHHGHTFSEVTVAVAENDYEKAERLLRQALREDKNSLVLRMKLLEIYTKKDDKAAFDQMAESMLKRGLVQENDPIWQRIRRMYVDRWIYDQ